MSAKDCGYQEKAEPEIKTLKIKHLADITHRKAFIDREWAVFLDSTLRQ
jgi:hypothetical protein